MFTGWDICNIRVCYAICVTRYNIVTRYMFLISQHQYFQTRFRASYIVWMPVQVTCYRLSCWQISSCQSCAWETRSVILTRVHEKVLLHLFLSFTETLEKLPEFQRCVQCVMSINEPLQDSNILYTSFQLLRPAISMDPRLSSTKIRP